MAPGGRWGTGKPDRNQAEIVTGLRDVGARVWILSVHPGLLDLLVYYRGRLYWLEVKMPGEMLTKKEREIFEQAPGVTFIVHSLDEALGLIGAVSYVV